MKRIFLIYHGRFPGEKAAALFAAQEAGSFAAHTPVTLLVPRRLGRIKESPHSHYGLPSSVRIVYLMTIDLFSVPLFRKVAFPVSYFAFSLAILLYGMFRFGRNTPVVTNEPLPALVATFFSRNTLFEVHDFPEHFRTFYMLLFSRVHTVLATNEWKRGELIRRFKLHEAKVIVERNGVDVETFAPRDKARSRTALGLPADARIALYTGHLYAHKGVDTLAAAARLLPEVQVYVVGGTDADVARFKKAYADVRNLHVVGHRPHHEMPLWQGAADVLVIPNSGKEELSARYTSPMKLFEYMASGRPIVASDLPAIGEVLPQDVGFITKPDNAAALADAIQRALTSPDAHARAKRAQTLVMRHAWEMRARRIVDLLPR